ncbi:hypothetical protein NXF25_016790 [Crotalus adamanteus]|uniref:Uncharacterized protein n=1 Tax=Crotalus adamanteus TaxID=8729 RepID=A0AAW1ASF6_CROAD
MDGNSSRREATWNESEGKAIPAWQVEANKHLSYGKPSHLGERKRKEMFIFLSAALRIPFLLNLGWKESTMMDNSSLLLLLSTDVQGDSKRHDILPKWPRGFHFLRTSVSSGPLIRARGTELRWPGQTLGPAVYKRIWRARELCCLMKKNITPEGTKRVIPAT